jgi:hypothetical protein
MVSPQRVSTTNAKRKTIITDGKRHVVERSASGSPNRAVKSPGSGSRRRKMKKGDGDIFGDFFGFGPNPPGCMSKGAEPVNIKSEKEKFIALLSVEARRYDINGMKSNLSTKID